MKKLIIVSLSLSLVPALAMEHSLDEKGVALIEAAKAQNESKCRELVDSEIARMRKRNPITLLMCLNRLKNEGNECARLLYRERNSLVRPHIAATIPTTISRRSCFALLMCLKDLEGKNFGAHTLYWHFKNLLLPHIRPYLTDNESPFKPLTLLGIRDKRGNTAFDYLPLEWLKPETKNVDAINTLIYRSRGMTDDCVVC